MHTDRPANRRLDACSGCFSSEKRKICSSLKILNETLYLCIKKTMYIEYRKNDKDSFLKAIMSEKDRVAHQRESLIRHCTMTSATLIGLVTVFGDTSSQCMSLRVLTVCGVLFLLLSVLVGVCFCFLVSFNALQRTGECATAISSKEYPSRRITRLASLRNTCESLSLAVEPRCSTFVGKHSVIFTDSLRKSAFFSSLFVFSSIFCCVSENYYYLCIGSFLVRGLDPTFRQS